MGSSPPPGIPRRSRGRARRSTPLRGPRPSVLPLTLVSRARAPPVLGEAPAPLLAPPLVRRWPAGGEPHHRAAMAAGQLAPELLRPYHLHYRVRFGKVATLVVTSSLVTSPTTSSRRTSAASSASGADAWGPDDPRARCQSLCVCMCDSDPGVPSVFFGWFLKRVSKMISKME